MQTKFRNKDKKSCLLAQFFPSSYCFMTFVPAKKFKQVVTAESLNAAKFKLQVFLNTLRDFLYNCVKFYTDSAWRRKKKRLLS